MILAEGTPQFWILYSFGAALVCMVVGLPVNWSLDRRFWHRDIPLDRANPVCRSCRHSLKGIQATKCPECGFDFAAGGVHRSGWALGCNLLVVWAMLTASCYAITWGLLSSKTEILIAPSSSWVTGMTRQSDFAAHQVQLIVEEPTGQSQTREKSLRVVLILNNGKKHEFTWDRDRDPATQVQEWYAAVPLDYPRETEFLSRYLSTKLIPYLNTEKVLDTRLEPRPPSLGDFRRAEREPYRGVPDAPKLPFARGIYGTGLLVEGDKAWQTVAIVLVSLAGSLFILRYVVQKYRRIQFARSCWQEQSQDETNSRADRD